MFLQGENNNNLTGRQQVDGGGLAAGAAQFFVSELNAICQLDPPVASARVLRVAVRVVAGRVWTMDLRTAKQTVSEAEVWQRPGAGGYALTEPTRVLAAGLCAPIRAARQADDAAADDDDDGLTFRAPKPARREVTFACASSAVVLFLTFFLMLFFLMFFIFLMLFLFLFLILMLILVLMLILMFLFLFLLFFLTLIFLSQAETKRFPDGVPSHHHLTGGTFPAEQVSKFGELQLPADFNAPTSYDLRAEAAKGYDKCVRGDRVQNQGLCGSCWSFSTHTAWANQKCMRAMDANGINDPTYSVDQSSCNNCGDGDSSLHAPCSGKLQSSNNDVGFANVYNCPGAISPQYQVDCNQQNAACDGGTLHEAWKWTMTQGGVSESSYRYGQYTHSVNTRQSVHNSDSAFPATSPSGDSTNSAQCAALESGQTQHRTQCRSRVRLRCVPPPAQSSHPPLFLRRRNVTGDGWRRTGRKSRSCTPSCRSARSPSA